MIDGSVEFSISTGQRKIVESGTQEAKHPIANNQPRKVTATAASDVKIVLFDTDLLDMLMTWHEVATIEVDEVEDSGDWMTRILQSKAFMQVPPANIQAMFMRMEEVSYKTGHVVIKEGDEGDYYYIIKKGKCKVTRSTKTGSELTLATLREVDSFGEDALLSNAKRNANVIMLTNGTLMRLAKQDFADLLEEPLINWVTGKELDQMVTEGAVLVDVRLESEYKNEHIPKSINIPLFMLRIKSRNLDQNKKYTLYCDTGKRSSASAFILSEIGIDTYCLKGGMIRYSGK